MQSAGMPAPVRVGTAPAERSRTGGEIMPKVGIVTRTKDRPATLARALHSALGQTFDDWNMALVNDGGDADALEAYLDREAAAIRNRLVLVHHDTSQGRCAAANADIDALDSDFVVLLDDDDSWAPGFLAATVRALSEAPRQIAGVCTRAIEVFEVVEGEVVRIKRRQPFNPELSAIGIATMAQANLIIPNTFLYRRCLHEELGYYDESLPVLEDWDFYLRIIRHYDIRLLEEALAFWHKREAARESRYANSVIGAVDIHRETDAFIRNRYLRRDMDAGVIGMGTLMALGRQSMRVDEIVQVGLRRSGLGRLRRLAAGLGFARGSGR